MVPEQPVPIIPDDRLCRLLAACAGKDFDARRDTALIVFFLDTGGRLLWVKAEHGKQLGSGNPIAVADPEDPHRQLALTSKF
jgi:hypothetical protein